MSYGDQYGHDPLNDFPAEYFQYIEVGDLNNDQLPDILISGKARIYGIAYFENTGTLLNPTFSLVAPQQIVPSTTNYDSWIHNIAFPLTTGSLQVPELFPADCTVGYNLLDLFWYRLLHHQTER